MSYELHLQGLLNKIESAPEDEALALTRHMIKEIYISDFYLFAKYGLSYRDMNWQTHGEAIETLEADSDRKLIVLPRGSFKSSLACVAYPIWRLLRNPNLTMLIDSEIFNNSKNFLREIKRHLQSKKFIDIFGEQIGPVWNETEIEIASRNQIRKEASITVGGIETTKVGQHYDLIIGDDYNSPQNSDTPEKCQKAIDHIRYNLNILNPGGEYVIIGTRYSERDVSGWILKDILNEKYFAEGKMKFFTGENGLIEQEPDELLQAS